MKRLRCSWRGVVAIGGSDHCLLPATLARLACCDKQRYPLGPRFRGDDDASSGWGGGDGGGGVERVDRGLADEEAEDLAERFAGHADPVPIGVADAVLLLVECFAAAGFFLHQFGDGVAAAEQDHDVGQGVPEGGVADGWDDAEIEGDGEEDAAHGETAYLTLEVLHGGHVQFGIVPEGGTARAGGVLARWEGFGGWRG